MSSPETSAALSLEERVTLLGVARASIVHGLRHAAPLPIRDEEHSAPLRRTRASFVTLERAGTLRGCIGSIEPRRPLIVDVAENAYLAAFRDPRFVPMREPEVDDLEIHVSILSPMEPVVFESEEDLLRQLRPGLDGLVLAEGPQHATFLPSVWEALPEARLFLRQLKLKAGWIESYWSSQMRASRYTAEVIGSPLPGATQGLSA